MKQTMTIQEGYAFKELNQSCILLLSGDIVEVLTDNDIPDDMRRPRQISVQQFRDRFTKAETALFIAATRTDNDVATLQFKLSTAQEPLDLDGETLQQGMLKLVAVGVITEARRVEILS